MDERTKRKTFYIKESTQEKLRIVAFYMKTTQTEIFNKVLEEGLSKMMEGLKINLDGGV
jgi:hypothetical protein